MEWIKIAVGVFMHLDNHLDLIIRSYGMWTYGLLFLIVFCETGLVVTPFLPGDSLLFATGALAAATSLHVSWGFVLLSVAKIGPKIFSRDDVRFLNKKHLERTHMFYEKYGGKTIIFARFIPIIRTFAPFVAGIAEIWRHRREPTIK